MSCGIASDIPRWLDTFCSQLRFGPAHIVHVLQARPATQREPMVRCRIGQWRRRSAAGAPRVHADDDDAVTGLHVPAQFANAGANEDAWPSRPIRRQTSTALEAFVVDAQQGNAHEHTGSEYKRLTGRMRQDAQRSPRGSLLVACMNAVNESPRTMTPSKSSSTTPRCSARRRSSGDSMSPAGSNYRRCSSLPSVARMKASPTRNGLPARTGAPSSRGNSAFADQLEVPPARSDAGSRWSPAMHLEAAQIAIVDADQRRGDFQSAFQLIAVVHFDEHIKSRSAASAPSDPSGSRRPAPPRSAECSPHDHALRLHDRHRW